MIKNKLLLILLFIIFTTGFLFSTPIVKIDDQSLSYTNSFSNNYMVKVTADSNCTNEQDFINITISSSKLLSHEFPIYCNLGYAYSGYFKINLTENDLSNQVPNILVSTQDTVTVTYLGASASLWVDTISPILGTFSLVPQDANSKVNDYYKGNVNVSTISGFSDSFSGLKEYHSYLVPFSNVNSYITKYTKKIITDINKTSISLELLSNVPDGNYYVILDASDNAGNLGKESSAIDNKKILLLDNTPPQVSAFNLGTFTDNATYYIPATTTILSIRLSDLGSGIKEESLSTQLDRNKVKLADYNSSFGGFYVDFNGKDFDINGFYEFAATDLLGNKSVKNFTIIIDSISPTTPTVPTLTRDLDNNITISNWGSSNDTMSGLKEYSVYRSTSSFTTLTNQTLVCTVPASATKTCVDSSSKSDATTYHYGVVAVDFAGNLSLVNSTSIKTGPSLSISLDFNYSSYINTPTPRISLDYSSDVNALRFSCNGSTFTAWIDVSNTSTSYNGFNITSGNGCSLEQGEKKLYVEARSENEPYLITRKSKIFKYDSIAPTVPSNLVATELSNGAIKLSWSASTDINGSGVNSYYIYYSETDTLSSSSPFLITSSTEYTFKPNKNSKFYFKVASVDKVSNISALSSESSANARRFGPSFVFNVSPKNFIEDVYYLKKGVASFSVTSDQELIASPTVKLKIGNGSFTNLVSSYNKLIATFTYDIQTSGEGVVEITGTNLNNETSTDIFYFISDANVPVFDVNTTLVEEDKLYIFTLDSFSEDVFRVQYLLNNNEEICFTEDINSKFECVFNTSTYPDDVYKMNVVAYDFSLNHSSKTIDFEIDNVDEVLLLKQTLIKEVYENKKTVENRINFLKIISFSISKEVLNDFNLANEKIILAEGYENSNVFSESVAAYTSANNLLLEILNILPVEKILKTKTIVIDIINHNYDLNAVIVDQNVLLNNLNFYDVNNPDLNKLFITREFFVFEISGQNYYSSVLNFKNDSSKDQIVSFIEFIPKSFASDVKNIYFDKNVHIVNKDPIVLYNLVIPKGSIISTNYLSIEPITSFDVLVKFDSVVYDSPLLLTGTVSPSDVNLSKPRFSSKTLFLVSVIFLIILILLLVVWLISSSHKKKDSVFEEFSSKPAMNKYLSGKEQNNSTLESLEKEDINKSNVEKKQKFNNNYEFILDAVKRNNK